ncbi:hypothetical protein WSM22_23240 [Cytophagales bacterium WSM2-2]|nr:hypothetical protein WSM22_23240 [Cytophagales bacterium WSM2-2]
MLLTTEDKILLVKSRLAKLDRDLTDEQLDFIIHPTNDPCYLSACPGSGKTEVVGIKAAYEISTWKNPFSGIAILSFTKNAAKEITDRVKLFGGVKATQHPHFIGTIDSWLHGYVLHPFAHKSTAFSGTDEDKSYRLIDSEERYDYLNPFKTIISQKPSYKDVWVNDYYFECSDPPELQSQSRTLAIQTIPGPVRDKLRENKKAFLTSGLTTYADAEFLCFYFLKGNQGILQNLVKRFPMLIIDECQDLSNNQLEILKLLVKNGTIIHFVGDHNQSIYEFKKVYIEKINDFISDNKLTKKALTQNFRSNQSIVNVSMSLEKYNTGNAPQAILGVEKEISSKSCLLWEYTGATLPQLPQKLIDHVNHINSITLKTDKKIDINKSCILARAHTTLSGFKNQPIFSGSKMEIFANGLNCWINTPRTGQDMKNALQQIGKSISMLAYNGKGNHQHQYTPKGYNQIEWRNQLYDLIESVCADATVSPPFTGLTWSQWAANFKVFLKGYWAKFRSPVNDWSSVKTKIMSPSGSAQKLVIDTLRVCQYPYSEKIRMTTFHDVKGETLDAVLVVSAKDKKSKGGYFEHWLTEIAEEKEYVRFAYVASSRPKHLLIWAIPKIENNQYIEKIKHLGFEIE